jgi:hypothetical protein
MYASTSKIKFIFMTDGEDIFPSREVYNIKRLMIEYRNKIEYSGIEFQSES